MWEFSNDWVDGEEWNLFRISYHHKWVTSRSIYTFKIFGVGFIYTVKTPRPPAVRDVLKTWEKENGIT